MLGMMIALGLGLGLESGLRVAVGPPAAVGVDLAELDRQWRSASADLKDKSRKLAGLVGDFRQAQTALAKLRRSIANYSQTAAAHREASNLARRRGGSIPPLVSRSTLESQAKQIEQALPALSAQVAAGRQIVDQARQASDQARQALNQAKRDRPADQVVADKLAELIAARQAIQTRGRALRARFDRESDADRRIALQRQIDDLLSQYWRLSEQIADLAD